MNAHENRELLESEWAQIIGEDDHASGVEVLVIGAIVSGPVWAVLGWLAHAWFA